jgi:hypothetical protein
MAWVTSAVVGWRLGAVAGPWGGAVVPGAGALVVVVAFAGVEVEDPVVPRVVVLAAEPLPAEVEGDFAAAAAAAAAAVATGAAGAEAAVDAGPATGLG